CFDFIFINLIEYFVLQAHDIKTEPESYIKFEGNYESDKINENEISNSASDSLYPSINNDIKENNTNDTEYFHEKSKLLFPPKETNATSLLYKGNDTSMPNINHFKRQSIEYKTEVNKGM
ncbi:uncharacterized protein LOC111617190, partial [Centruroides sculpturatus]|uniref:uncharacterized protein LOC111617190 n=1 Tax=Centruroides sculpturatus TaxID=218467 RepID=UPI000C6D4CE5